MVGKRYFSRHRPLFRQVGMLVTMPFMVMTISFALFSQTLTVNGNESSVAYVSNNYTTWTYTKTATLAAGIYTYRLNPFVIKNNGVTSITAWQVQFSVPVDTTAINCPTSVTCTINNTSHVVTITRTVTIAPGASSTINTGASTAIRFTTTTANYIPQNVNISATYSTAYQTIAGLTVTASLGPKSGTNYPINMTITNSSGQAISGWQVVLPVNKRCTSVTGLPAGVTYTCTTTRITLTGASVPIANGATYSFTAPLPNAVASGVFNMTGVATVTGRA